MYLEAVASEVAQVAARFVREHAGSARAAGTKTTPTDVVTHTDVASEKLIRDELRARCPGSSIVGEEFDVDVGGSNVGWIVDPIDGTVNFLYNLPVVSVSIAATIDGVVVAGAVADVHRGEVFSAAAGGGARRDREPVVASDRETMELALVGTGFAYDAALRAEQAATLAQLLPACRDIRCMGSAALNLSWIGCGRLDGYFERDLKVYDYAAGALIAREGGASVELPIANDRNEIIAATPAVFDSLRSLVRSPAR